MRAKNALDTNKRSGIDSPRRSRSCSSLFRREERMPHWRTLPSWFRSLLFRSRVETALDDELRFHIEEQIDAGISDGLSPDESRRRAYSSLGAPPALVKDQCRD